MFKVHARYRIEHLEHKQQDNSLNNRTQYVLLIADGRIVPGPKSPKYESN